MDEVADVVGHRRKQGRHSPHNYIYRLRLKGFGPKVALEYRPHLTNTPPPCNKRKHLGSKDGNPVGGDIAPKDSGNPLESEPAIRQRK